jgi:UDP-N-acetylmuramoyl-L-alanyl-D-glutamate--2,6-diaminopimelate ligase
MKHSTALKDLLSAATLSADGTANPIITGLMYDSRGVQSGDLFFAIKGAHSDGHAFIPDVAKAGAAAVIAERAVPASVPVIATPKIFEAMSKIAHVFFDRPSQKLPVIGITGTNGKTTSTFLIENILRANKKTCGVIGTVNYRIDGEEWPAPNTTPFSIDVHRFLALMVEKKVDAGVMEVSSHALAMNRVDDVRFTVGVFMNLTQDHLDYHKTMEKYFEAKSKLFKRPEEPKAVVNIDDEYGRRLADGLKSKLTFGMSEQAMLRATDVKCDLNGLAFTLTFPTGETRKIHNNLLGLHNVSNCLGAAGAMLAFGLDKDQVSHGLKKSTRCRDAWSVWKRDRNLWWRWITRTPMTRCRKSLPRCATPVPAG